MLKRIPVVNLRKGNFSNARFWGGKSRANICTNYVIKGLGFGKFPLKT
jgi:hypothetical protein